MQIVEDFEDDVITPSTVSRLSQLHFRVPITVSFASFDALLLLLRGLWNGWSAVRCRDRV